MALARYDLLRPCVEGGISLTEVARTQCLPRRTVQRWLAQYRHAGLVRLARRGRSDQGSARALLPECKEVIEGLALRKPPPSVALVHRQACEIARQQGWEVPAYHGVYRVIRQLDPALLTLAHEGSKAYRLTFDLLHRREASTANEIWQADHTQSRLRRSHHAVL